MGRLSFRIGKMNALKTLPGMWGSPLWKRFGRHKDLVKKTVVTVVSLGVIYYLATTLVAWITAPRIEMTMSPVVGRIAVVAEPAKLEPIQRKVTYTGSVAPVQEVTVYPRVEGWVNEFRLYEGDWVTKGQVIARLDRVELTAMVSEAQTNQEFWEKELPRFETLVKRGAIAQSEYDNAVKQAETARAKLEVLKTRYSYTDILAPISGRVSKRHIYAGILVKAGMPIVDLQDLSRVRVQVKVAGLDAPYVRVGTEALIRFPTLPSPHQERRAKVTTVFPQLDPVTRTSTVEVVLNNPGDLIKPDMYAVVDLILEKKAKTLTIPRLAVLEGPDKQPIVYVTDSVSAMSRPVKLGIAEGDRVEVVEGVKEGELVVRKGQRSLSEGAQVNLVTGL